MGPGGRGPGRGPGRGGPGGPHGARFGEKVKLKNAKGTIFRLLGYLRHVKVALILATQG